LKIYLAGPLFTTPERDWNVGLAARLRAGGHDVFVPQENPAGERTGRAIFLKDLEGLDWADGVVAIMDGADPDSGTWLGMRLRLCAREAGDPVPQRLPGIGRRE